MRKAIIMAALLGAVGTLALVGTSVRLFESQAPSAIPAAAAAENALPVLPFDIMLKFGRKLPTKDWGNAF